MLHCQILFPCIFRSDSRRLEDNDALKCSANNFPFSPEIFFQYGKLSELGPKKHTNSFQCLTKFLCYLWTSSHDWRTMVHWNIVPVIFHIDQLSRGLFKIVKRTFLFIVVLQLQGDWPHCQHAWNQDLRVQHMPSAMPIWQECTRKAWLKHNA